MKYMPSIRKKITLGYYALVAVMIGASIITFAELHFLEKKISVGEIISEFFDTALEIRRFEKNFFLYKKKFDYDENLKYVDKAQKILEKNAADFVEIAAPRQIGDLRENLRKYSVLMRQYGRVSVQNERVASEASVRRIELEDNIRQTGKDITTLAEDISKAERKNLQRLLINNRRVLILSIGIVALLAAVIGQVLAKIVVRPLAALEKSMELIAEGRSDAVQIRSRDQEILSLTKAFNKMLKDLELQQRHLIQSEKLASLGTLLSGVAHELNNPLSNISSSSQILTEEFHEGDREHQKELIAQINDQTDRARNIVRSLLEFSRDKEFKKQALPLKPLLEETIRFIRGQVPTGVTITLNVAEDTTIVADKQRMQQVFLNLIKNALEAFPDGRGAISIKAEKRRAIDDVEDEKIGIYNYMKFRGKCTLEDDTVDIEIRDTGAGIPLELLPKIFDPFFTTKDVGKGSGLGLFIVHEIIEEHDGCIAVDSEPGKGTAFLIRLPVK
jgi:signal transduction histidine kinase